jgi:cytochrome P450
VPTRTNRRYKRAVKEMQEFVDGLIDERRGRADEYDDLLSLLLTATDEEGRGLSETEVRDQMITFLGAGTETTALALTYAFLELSQHDDARATLDAEHESVLGADPPTLADLGDLTYTEQVIDEAMRLYPPAYITFREASEDVALGGYRIPQGTKVVLPQYHVHTDERWYDGPDQFRPDRWTEEFREQLHDYAFFPFGGGPRHCIGMRFAMMELKCVLSTVAQRVEFELLSDPDPEFSLGVTLRPKNDVRVRVHER